MLAKIDEDLLTGLADAIRDVSDSEETYYPSDMADAVKKIYIFITQEDYDNLESYDPDTIYLIEG